MRWEDERYVRVYTRDTVDWLGLSFIAQGLFCLILRKVDRAGLLKLGKPGKRGVAIVVGFPGDWPRLEPALEELLADGCVRIQGEYLIVPNFIEAQEATQSEAQRKRESRGRARDAAAAAAILNPDKPSDSVTECHDSGQKVTPGHEASQVVTPNRAVPSRTEPDPPPPAHAREAGPSEPATPPPPVVAPPPRFGPAKLAADLAAAKANRSAEAWPLTAALLDACWAGGWEAEWPRDRAAARQVEAAVSRVGVSTAAERLLAMVAADRAQKLEPKPWLGWHQDVIDPETARGVKRDAQVGHADPSPAEAFQEGERAINR